MAGSVYAEPWQQSNNFHVKAVAKEGGRREDIAGGFCWWEKRKDWEKENEVKEGTKGRKGQEENHDVEMNYLKNKDVIECEEPVNCDERYLKRKKLKYV